MLNTKAIIDYEYNINNKMSGGSDNDNESNNTHNIDDKINNKINEKVNEIINNGLNNNVQNNNASNNTQNNKINDGSVVAGTEQVKTFKIMNENNNYLNNEHLKNEHQKNNYLKNDNNTNNNQNLNNNINANANTNTNQTHIKFDNEKNIYIVYDGNEIECSLTNQEILRSIIDANNNNYCVRKYLFIVSFNKEKNVDEFYFDNSIFTNDLNLMMKVQNFIHDTIMQNLLIENNDVLNILIIFYYQMIIFMFKNIYVYENQQDVSKIYSILTFRFSSLVLKQISKIQNDNDKIKLNCDKILDIKNKLSDKIDLLNKNIVNSKIKTNVNVMTGGNDDSDDSDNSDDSDDDDDNNNSDSDNDDSNNNSQFSSNIDNDNEDDEDDEEEEDDKENEDGEDNEDDEDENENEDDEDDEDDEDEDEDENEYKIMDNSFINNLDNNATQNGGERENEKNNHELLHNSVETYKNIFDSDNEDNKIHNSNISNNSNLSNLSNISNNSKTLSYNVDSAKKNGKIFKIRL